MTTQLPARIRHRLGSLLLLVAFLCHPAVLLAPPPAWWAERGATNANPPDDYAAANLGQLKQMAVKAREELNFRLHPDGAGQPIEDLIAGWAQPNPVRDDSAAATLGQLKYVGKLYYDRLTAVGSTRPYPWAGSANPAEDTAVANLGQVKRVFSFDLTYTDEYGNVSNDVDGNGLPDAWEMEHFGGLNVPGGGAGESWNHDGVTNLYKFQNGINPTSVNGTQQTENPGGTHVALKIFTPLE